jgi:hypothetical protein
MLATVDMEEAKKIADIPRLPTDGRDRAGVIAVMARRPIGLKCIP